MKSSVGFLATAGLSALLFVGCNGSGQVACSGSACNIPSTVNGSGTGNVGSGQGAGTGTGTTASPAASPAGTATGSSSWACFLTAYQSGQIGLPTGTGSTTQTPNGSCGLGSAPTGTNAFTCYVMPAGQTQPTLGWCLLGTASPVPGSSSIPVVAPSSSASTACTPSGSASAIQLSVPCLTLTVGQKLSVTLSENGYAGMFTPSVANGAFVTSGIDNTQNNTFTFTGAAAGTTTATFSDQNGNSTTMQIVVH